MKSYISSKLDIMAGQPTPPQKEGLNKGLLTIGFP